MLAFVAVLVVRVEALTSDAPMICCASVVGRNAVTLLIVATFNTASVVQW